MLSVSCKNDYSMAQIEPSGASAGKRGRLPTTQIAISQVMADGAPRKPSEVAEVLGLTPGAASAAMRRMARTGVLQNLGAGRYQREDVEPLHPDPTLPLGGQSQPQKQEWPDSGKGPPSVDRSSASQTSRKAQQDGSLRDDVARAAFAAKLWLKDAALFRFNDYHWEKRRRRMHDHDRKSGRATAR